MAASGTPIGIVLAGGRGRRLGGAKPGALLDGRTLLTRALDALEPVCDERAIVAKADTVLPALGDDVPVWIEPEEEHHPRHGLVHALRVAGDRPVLVLAVDLPLVPAALLAELRDVVLGGATAAIARAGGRAQPLCAAYAPRALGILGAAAADEPLTRTVRRVDPVWVDTDEASLCNVNDAEDLARASALLGRG